MRHLMSAIKQWRLEREVRAALAELPDTPDKIAGFLKRNGYEGIINDGNRCPTARFLADSLGSRRRKGLMVAVGVKDIRVWIKPASGHPRVHTIVPLADSPLREFTNRLTKGLYPRLTIERYYCSDMGMDGLAAPTVYPLV